MPRDRRAVIGTGIWSEPTIQALSRDQQHAYLLAYTQPDLNRCGVLPYRPARWTKLAADLTAPHLRRQYTRLHASRHVVVDEDYEELLIRTYIGHDGLLAQPLVVAAMVRDYQEIVSPTVRLAILTELRRLFDTERPDAERKGLLLLLGIDPEKLGIATGKSEQLARIRGAIGDGLKREMGRAIVEGHVDPYPEGPVEGLPEGLVVGLPDPLTRGRSRMSPSPTPSPTPVPTPATGGSPRPTDPAPTDDPCMSLLIEHVHAYDVEPPETVRNATRVQIQKLYADGTPPDLIRAALTRMRFKQLGPRLLPELVAEVTPTTATATATTRSTADERVAGALALAAHYDAQEQP